jgi:hypothetical protein
MSISVLVEKKKVSYNYSTVTFTNPNLSISIFGLKKGTFCPNWSDFVEIRRMFNFNFQISGKKICFFGKKSNKEFLNTS